MIWALAPVLAALVVWMLACAWCGFRGRLAAFAAVFGAGLVINQLWIVYGLNASPFEFNALVAQGAAATYAICAGGIGWFAGRLRRVWVESRVR